MRNLCGVIFIFLCFNSAKSQELKAFQIYNKEQGEVAFAEMIEQLAGYDVVLFGEFHNNSILHWLQLKTTQALYRKKGENLVLGAEMFERDNQQEINAYLLDTLNLEQLEERARLWKNFKTDYLPLLDFAKSENLAFIATNIPRRYAKMVAKNGLDSLKNLPDNDQTFIAKFPIKVDLKTPGYQEMKQLMENHVGDKIMNYIQAQAVKDVTMAEAILDHRKGEQLFLHFNGNYHSKAYGGIYWYLKKRKAWLKGLKIAVITVAQSPEKYLPVPNEVVPTEFIIVVPKDMTKTY